MLCAEKTAMLQKGNLSCLAAFLSVRVSHGKNIKLLKPASRLGILFAVGEFDNTPCCNVASLRRK